jgi:DNA excision repair protein ERCC-3
MYFSAKRQGFLIDQGYSFKVISQLQGIQKMPGLVFPTRDAQIELLQNVLLQGEDKADLIGASEYERRMKKVRKGVNAPLPAAASVIRNVGSMTALSGAQHMSYHEQGKLLK